MQTQAKQTIYASMKNAAAGLVALTLVGCGPSPTIQMQRETQQKIEMETASRYEIKRVAVFQDEIAYNEVRGIYELKDKETGKIYIGISGIGITERGYHQSGKTTAEDER